MNEPLLLALLFATFLAAGFVKGVTGMGLPTVAMGLLGATMTPAAAAAMLIIPSAVTNLWQLLAGPATARLVRRFWSMVIGIVIGTLAGTTLMIRVDPRWSSLGLGLALILYATYALRAPSVSVPARHERRWSPAIGLATGLITGATGVSTMPAAPYLQALRLDRDDLVQALGLTFTTSATALAIGLYAHDALRLEQVGLSALSVIPALIGMRLGQAIRSRISQARFRQCFLGFLLLLGFELAIKSFL